MTEAHYNGDTVSISVIDSAPSPWSTGTVSFPAVAASAAARHNFAAGLIAFCQQHRLDGVDLEWEPVKSTEVASYGQLIALLRAAFQPHRLMLSAAVHASNKDIPASAAANLDWVGVMTYGHKATDHSTYADTVTYLTRWVNYGVPKSKLLMGVPFYGRNATSASKTYRAIVDEFHPAAAQENIGSWGFSGIDTTKRKMNYVYDHGMAGTMIRELGQDHLDAAGNQTAFSLLSAIKSVVTSRTSAAASLQKVASILSQARDEHVKQDRITAMLKSQTAAGLTASPGRRQDRTRMTVRREQRSDVTTSGLTLALGVLPLPRTR